MGSSISALYDDHDTYVSLCKVLNVSHLDIRDEESFYKHGERLVVENKDKIKALGLENSYMVNKFK